MAIIYDLGENEYKNWIIGENFLGFDYHFSDLDFFKREFCGF